MFGGAGGDTPNAAAVTAISAGAATCGVPRTCVNTGHPGQVAHGCVPLAISDSHGTLLGSPWQRNKDRSSQSVAFDELDERTCYEHLARARRNLEHESLPHDVVMERVASNLHDPAIWELDEI